MIPVTPFKTLPLALFMAFLYMGCTERVETQTEKTTHHEDAEAITDVSKARAEAFNQGNALGIALHFTEDAVLMAPGKPATYGKDSVQAYYQGIFDQYETELESYYEEVEVSGDLAYGRGKAKVKLLPKDGGETLYSTAKYLNILKRQPDGTWKTTHDIWNGNELTD